MSFIRSQIAEIADDPALQIYGASLALVNALTSVYWLVQQPLFADIVAATTPPVCWPFLPQCGRLRILTPETATIVIVTMGACAVLNAFFFLHSKVTAGWWGLVGVSMCKSILVFMDYRLILNQHYMAFWVAVPFLFVPDKRRVLRYLLALFYLWAGTLKLNDEWLSGLALYGLRPLGMPATLVPWACAYVVFLELLGVFGLFAKRPTVFWLSLGQFILFHVSSFWVVGFFYPLLMFLLLSLFPLTRESTDASGQGFQPVIAPVHLRIRPCHAVVVGIFCVAQLVPLATPGDSSITGEGRAFALHMFDAPVSCVASMTYRPPSGVPQPVPVGNLLTNARLACDPIVYFNYAHNYCRVRDLNNAGGDIDLLLQSRKGDRAEYQTVVSIQSFCRAAPTYRMWRHNPWIEPTQRVLGPRAAGQVTPLRP